MFLEDLLLSWKCKRHDRVSKSSTEVEYRAMPTACPEIIWFHGLLSELGSPQNQPIRLHAYYTSVIHINEIPVFHECTKHIEVDRHYIHYEYMHKTTSLSHISTILQIADIFTK